MLTIKIQRPGGLEDIVETKRCQWSQEYSGFSLDEGNLKIHEGAIAYVMNDNGITIGKYVGRDTDIDDPA